MPRRAAGGAPRRPPRPRARSTSRRGTATPCIGELQFPAEFEATLGVEGVEPAADDDGVPGLRRRAGSRVEAALDDDGGGADAAAELRRRRAPSGRAAGSAGARRARWPRQRDCGVRRGRPHPVPGTPGAGRADAGGGAHAEGGAERALLPRRPRGTEMARDARDPRDPILWFAALVATSARQAQARFRRAVDPSSSSQTSPRARRDAALRGAPGRRWEPVVSRKTQF